MTEYDYTIAAEWKGDSIEGTVGITLDSVSGKPPTILPNVTKSKEEKVNEAMKTTITAKIKETLEKFIEELNSK